MSNTKVERIFKSVYGAEELITPTQYIAELIIARQSKFLKTKLPNLFWKNPLFDDWTKKYLNQKRRADALIRGGYSYKVILKALNSKNGLYICSLFNKKIDILLEEESRKSVVEEVPASANNLVVGDSVSVRESTSTKKTTRISKLRD